MSESQLRAELEQCGLGGPAFDLSVLAESLAAWTGSHRRLRDLLEECPTGDPIAFRPQWTSDPIEET